MVHKRTTGIVGLAFIIVLASIFAVNQVNNDTWDETHWGGDTGEEEYSTQTGDGDINGTGGLCNSGICTTAIIVFSVVLLPSCVQYWKREDDE